MKPIQHYFRNMATPVFWTAVTIFLAILVASALMARYSANRLKQLENEQLQRGMRTVCVGRFLIDLPKEAQVEVGNARIHGFITAVFTETDSEFRRRVEERKAQLQAEIDWLGGKHNLEMEKIRQFDSGISGSIFVHGRKVTEGTRARGLELERYRNEGIATEALVHADELSVDLFAEYYDPDQLENLPQLVSQLVPNPHGDVPLEQGFCIDRAYFRNPLTAEQGEQIVMFVRLPSHPDIEFLLILAAGQKPDEETLLVRTAANESRLPLLDRLRVSTLKAAPRVIAGLAGEELIRHVAEANNTNGYSFWWEVNGSEDDVLIPHVVFQMTTGRGKDGPVPTSMSENAALALWNTVSSSIRLRPAVKPPTSHVAVQVAPMAAEDASLERHK